MADLPVAGLILAAGRGAGMKSDSPKALFPVCGVPMAQLVVRAMKGVGVQRPVIVVGPGDATRETLGDSCAYVLQDEQLGTGHAALAARSELEAHRGPLLVAPGDTPLLSSQVLGELLTAHRYSGAACTLATTRLQNPAGYGRVVRDPHGRAQKVVEEAEATPRIRAIQEVCTSVYCFDSETLFGMLPRLENLNALGAYYLTDVVELIYNAGGGIETRLFEDAECLAGVNDRWQLAEASEALRRRILRGLCLAGVTITDPATTFVSLDSEIGPDAVIEPMTSVTGATRIGGGSRIGPMAQIARSVIGERCTVLMSQLNGAILEDEVRCGPFANLRPGAVIGRGSRIGNFVEIKNAEIGDGASVSHLAYIGDAKVGREANIGAGTITCNFDGFAKHRTEIGEGAFVGSNSTLVAPVTIGEGAVVAAGSVITKDVPANALGIGREKQENKEGWAEAWRKRKQGEGKA